MKTMIEITQDLSATVGQQAFAEPVTHIYNPLEYAWRPHEQYLQQYAQGTRDVLMLGMNPGPFGMAQVGVPFGEIGLVRDWLEICEPVDKPQTEHPKRPITGFDCTRSEVSGRRVWSWAAERFGDADTFFQQFYVVNYCPLVFMEASGKNRTPDKLPKAERQALYAACDQALRETVAYFQPKVIIGVGRFAYDRAMQLFADEVECVVAPHPSPANPAANRGWAPLMDVVVDEVLASL